jgi:hypothetical protein
MRTILCIVVVLASMGCGSSSPEGPYCSLFNASTIGTIGCSCTQAGATFCADFPSSSCATLATGQCAGGVVSNASCPTANRVGSCFNAAFARRQYPQAPLDAGDFQQACNQQGECWVPN